MQPSSMRGFAKSRHSIVLALAFVLSSTTSGAESDSASEAAWTAWKKGDVIQAESMAENLDASSDRSHLLCLCSLVRGQYETALMHYADIFPSYSRYRELNRPVIDCYSHLGRYDDAVEFARKRKLGNVKTLQMRAAKPFKASLAKLSVIPFAKHRLTPYFPAFQAEIDDQAVTIHIDTGSSFIAMGPDHAETLGIQSVAYGQGYHGPNKVKLSLGIANKFQIGEAVLGNVPVIVFPTLRGKQMNFGTQVLQQFLSTLDYPNQRLILSPRDSKEFRKKHMALLPKIREKIPFYMWGNHYMFARGFVADDDHLNFFMDSGLVALRKINDDPTVQAGFTTSRERYRKWGIGEPAMDQGIFQSHLPIGLGPLRQEEIWFQSGPGGEAHGNRTFGGVQMHGCLAHAFVKHYSWTLDFENHEYIFSQSTKTLNRSSNITSVARFESEEPAPFAERILAIIDLILEKHIDPPTRQQMILAGTKTLYRADNRTVPKGLSQRISDLANADQTMDFLNDLDREFDTLKAPETILTHGILQSLPGRANLIGAEASKVQGQLAANRYVGVGIALSMNKDLKMPSIPKVFYNGPAWKAGVKPGDLILEIDGEATESKDLKQILQQLRGEDSSKVSIVVRQKDSKELRTLTMTRGRVFIPSVVGHREKSKGEWQYTVDSAKEIALIRIKSIGPSTLHELRQVEEKLRSKNVGGIILDLRSGGGTLHDIIMVADSLLDGGIIGHVRSLDSLQKHVARPGGIFQNVPMAVLVGKHTSSGNVFLTAALQDNERASVVGEPTAGETYVRSIIPVPGRDEKIVMAIGVLQRGDGTPLLAPRYGSSQRTRAQDPKTEKPKKRPGIIIPDHIIATEAVTEYAPIAKTSGKDLTLAKAIEVLRSVADQISSRSKNKNVTGE